MPPFGLPKLSADPVLFLPLWLGTLREIGSGGVVAPINDPGWSTDGSVDGIVFKGNVRLDIGNLPAYEIPNKTVFVAGYIEKNISAVPRFVSKRDSGGTDFEFYGDASGIRFVTGGGSSVLASTAWSDTKSVAVTHTDGLAASFYADGSYLGDGAAAVNYVSDDADISVGNIFVSSQPMNGYMTVALVFPSVLSADEILQLDTWSRSLSTPRQQFPGGGVATGQPLYRDNIQSARVSLGNETAGQLSNTGYTIESGTWKVLEDATSGERYIECVVAGRIWRRSVSGYGTWEFELYKFDDNNVPLVQFIASETVSYNQGSQDGWTVGFNASEKILVLRSIAGASTNKMFTADAYVSFGVRYRLRITRSALDVFTIYIKGGAFTTWTVVDATGGLGTNPFTDPVAPGTIYTVHNFTAGDRLYLDQHFKGAVTP